MTSTTAYNVVFDICPVVVNAHAQLHQQMAEMNSAPCEQRGGGDHDMVMPAVAATSSMAESGCAVDATDKIWTSMMGLLKTMWHNNRFYFGDQFNKIFGW